VDHQIEKFWQATMVKHLQQRQKEDVVQDYLQSMRQVGND